MVQKNENVHLNMYLDQNLVVQVVHAGYAQHPERSAADRLWVVAPPSLVRFNNRDKL